MFDSHTEKEKMDAVFLKQESRMTALYVVYSVG